MFWKRGIKRSLAEVVSACYCMAAIDGQVTDDELAMIRNAVAEFSDGEASAETIQALLDKSREQVLQHGVDGHLKNLGRRLADDARELILAATGATLIADGKVHDRERELFLSLAERFGFTPADASDLLEKVIAAANER